MRLFYSSFVFCLLLLSYNPISAHANESSIFISELNFAGTVAENGCKKEDASNRCAWDKWVEITNSAQQKVDISGWKLKMREGVGANEWFIFPEGASVEAHSSVVVGYYETGFFSTLVQSGYAPQYTSYSLLRMSNNELHTVAIALLDTAETIIDEARFSTQEFGDATGKSIEKTSVGGWNISTSLYGINFGTPGWYPYFTPIDSVPVPTPTVPVVIAQPEVEQPYTEKNPLPNLQPSQIVLPVEVLQTVEVPQLHDLSTHSNDVVYSEHQQANPVIISTPSPVEVVQDFVESRSPIIETIYTHSSLVLGDPIQTPNLLSSAPHEVMLRVESLIGAVIVLLGIASYKTRLCISNFSQLFVIQKYLAE